MDAFKWLEKWYYNNCNDDWEHGNGVKISTIDNPGWYVEINLIETGLEHKSFKSIQVERSEHDWIYCKVVDGVFIGAGGTANLVEIINVFKKWVLNEEDIK